MTDRTADKSPRGAHRGEDDDAERRELDFSTYLPFRLGVLSQRLLRESASTYKKGPIPLTTPQWMVFSIIANYQPLVASEISRISLIDEVGVSRAVAGLQRLHLVIRRRSRQDQRVLEISLTEAGLEFYREMAAKMFDQQALIQAAVTPDELRMLLGLVGRLDAVCASMADLRRIYGEAVDVRDVVSSIPGTGAVLSDISRQGPAPPPAGKRRRAR